MTEKELFEFGLKLKEKGRSATEIYQALSIKTDSKEILDSVLEKLKPKPTKKHSQERIRELLKENKKKLNFEYSIKSLYRIPWMMLILGLIVFGLSKEEVNSNAEYGVITIVQSLILYTMYFLVKKKGAYSILKTALIFFITTWALELLIFGIPNDLYMAYDKLHMRLPSQGMNIRFTASYAFARLFGIAFPYLYSMFKLVFAILIYLIHLRYTVYEALDEQTKEDLVEFSKK